MSWTRRAASRRIPARTASTGAATTAGEGFSVAGNMLAGAAVIDETAKAYAANAALPFPRRLIAALKAGEAAGGDKRGKQSAALLIYGEEEWPDLDLRVDDHTDPLAELERLEAVSRERWVHFAKFLPSKRNPGRHHRSRGARCRHRGGARRGEVMSCAAAGDRKPARGVPRRSRPAHGRGRRRRSLARARLDARPGRRVRLRQERDLARRDGPPAQGDSAEVTGARDVRRARACSTCRTASCATCAATAWR